MKINLWSKTLLNVYGCLNKVCDSIDSLVLNFGLRTGYKSSNFYDSFNQMNKMIDLMDKKILLINLKVLIEDTLKNLDEISQKILILKYFDKNRSEDVFRVLKISRRTFFRKSNQAIDKFSYELIRQGYTAEKLYDLLKDEAWIITIYNNFCRKDNKIEIFDDFRMVNMAEKIYRKINYYI